MTQNDDRTIPLDQLPAKVKVNRRGLYRVTILRQSGNLHAEQLVSGSPSDAVAVVIATFRRAQIDAVNVRVNGEGELSVSRIF